MKKIYQLLPLTFVVGLFGCGSNADSSANAEVETSTTTGAESEQVTSQSNLPNSAPVVKVITTISTPPFSFQDTQGNIQGLDVDVIRAIGENQGFKVDIQTSTWDELFNTVEKGESDLAISGISYNEDRNTKYGLSESYFFNPAAVMYRDASLDITSLDDLSELTIGTTSYGKSFELGSQIPDVQAIIAETPYLLFEELARESLDAAIYDYPVFAYISKNHPEVEMQITPLESSEDPATGTVIMTSLSNTELLGKINAGIRELKEDGTLDAIGQKWLAK